MYFGRKFRLSNTNKSESDIPVAVRHATDSHSASLSCYL